MVAVASPEFDALESAFDGRLAERCERELRGKEASAGMLCLFLVSTEATIVFLEGSKAFFYPKTKPKKQN